MTPHKSNKTTESEDAAVQAVRTLIEDEAAPLETVSAEDNVTSVRAAQLPPLAAAEDNVPADETSILRRHLEPAWQEMLARIKAYRPDRKRILWTSLVLMLLLQPFFVFGWSLFVIVLVWAVYVFWGGDVFWRRIIAMYYWGHQRWPETARQVKLRAYVMGKKWDWILDRAPDRLADYLRGPDVRRIIAADAEHHAAMSDRLTRLNRDRAPG